MNIDAETKVPLFAILLSVPTLVGGLLWLTSIDNKASAAQQTAKEMSPLVQEILIRVIRIEEHMKNNP